MNLLEIILAIVAGLVLFLFAINKLSETIQSVMGAKAKHWLLKFTANTFTAILTGTVITVLLDSSSAVIIITIVFVNAKLLTLKQAMGIVLGANIGTTVSSQIIAMDVGRYSPILLVVGFAMLFLTKSKKVGNIGKVVLYFGILFFGLFTMEKAVEPLKQAPAFLALLNKTQNPFLGSALGALVTLIIQSSSATVGMAIILTKNGLLSLAGAIAIMLGAELGTCSDTLLATVKGSRQAVKTGVFHLSFNLVSIMIGLLLFTPFVGFITWLGRNLPIERSVANAHTFFNIGGVLLFAAFIPFFEKILNKLIPEKSIACHGIFASENLNKNKLGIFQLHEEIKSSGI